MEEPTTKSDLEAAAESLPEHLELNHYVEIYRRSAERARVIVVTVMVFSVVMLVAQWNATDYSWSFKRYQTMSSWYEGALAQPESTRTQWVQAQTGGRYRSMETLKHALDEYRRIRLERVYVFEVPGIGITLDVNDLGFFSGIAYTLLLLLLLFAVMREYENLYLALFKVRRLHDRGVTRGGESTANYLYHALAMSQVFSAPPTLAQWRPSVAKRNIPAIVFLVPVLVQGYIVYTNYKTDYVLRWFQVVFNREMTPQYIFLGIVVVLAGLAAIYADASNYRWRSAFLHLNPALDRVAPIPWPVWIRLRLFRKRWSDHLERRMWAQVVQRLRLTTETVTTVIQVDYEIDVTARDISFAQIQEMCRELHNKAKDKAKLQCRHFRFVRVAIESSELDVPRKDDDDQPYHAKRAAKWTVKANFLVSCVKHA